MLVTRCSCPSEPRWHRRSRDARLRCRGVDAEDPSADNAAADLESCQVSPGATTANSARGRQGRGECVSEGVARERSAAGEHLEEHAPERPDVRALVDRPARAPARGSCTPQSPESRRHACRHVTVGECVRSGLPHRRSMALASPKSRTLTTPLGVILMLAGLRSRWTMPLSCAASSASAICRATAVPRRAGAARGRVRSARVGPSTSSRTSARDVAVVLSRSRRSRRCADDSAKRVSVPRARSGPADRDPSANSSGSTLSATSRFSVVS